MSYYEHFVITESDYDYNDTSSGFGSGLGDFGTGFEEPCDRELLSPSVQRVSPDLLFVLALPFWAVDAALGDWRVGAVMCVGVHVIYTVNLYGSGADPGLHQSGPLPCSSQSHRNQHTQQPGSCWHAGWCTLAPGCLLVSWPSQTWCSLGPRSREGEMVCTRLYPPENAPLWVSLFHLQTVLVGLVVPGPGAAGVFMRDRVQVTRGRG
ncbi:unnamed protein product, partial [Coregonus sp. 'balchen']